MREIEELQQLIDLHPGQLDDWQCIYYVKANQVFRDDVPL